MTAGRSSGDHTDQVARTCGCHGSREPPAAQTQEYRLATPNYSYEKRQRELAKKRKAEEKRQRKQNARPEDEASAGGAPAPTEPGAVPPAPGTTDPAS